MSADDRKDKWSGQAGPWATPPSRAPIAQPPRPRPALNRSRYWSATIFALLMLSVGIRAYKDLSQPEAWAYWKDQYFAPSLSASLIANADFDGSGRGHQALAIRGTIGAAAASWLRERLDEAHLAPGDTVLLSSPGGDVEQAVIMG